MSEFSTSLSEMALLLMALGACGGLPANGREAASSAGAASIAGNGPLADVHTAGSSNGSGGSGAAGGLVGNGTSGGANGGGANGGVSNGGASNGGGMLNVGGGSNGGVSNGGASNGGGALNLGGASNLGGALNIGGALSGGGGVLGLFTTEFDITESFISENGAWKQNGLDWTRVATSGGLAYGTQTGSNRFDDSYAYLSGSFPANQSASAVIHLEPGITAAYAEVEILLRWTDSAHQSTGYECNLAYNGQYAEIIQWPGPIGKQKSDFKFISSGNPVVGGVHDGDVFQADVVGNVITSRLNGKVIATGVDNSIPSGGAPGIGFYAEGASVGRKFSFSRFTRLGI